MRFVLCSKGTDEAEEPVARLATIQSGSCLGGMLGKAISDGHVLRGRENDAGGKACQMTLWEAAAEGLRA